MNKQQLASKIWESANRMRSKIEANEYKDYILGFIFYKYLSEKEEHWLLSQDYTPEDIREYVNEDDPETVRMTQKSMGYFIAYKDLFSTWIHMGSDFSVDNVRTALSSFSRLISDTHKKLFDNIFNTLETGLSKLGASTKDQTKAVQDLIQLIDEIPMNSSKDYDVIGFVYEYLIKNFAANAGKKAGEFYTPHEVSLLMSEIVAYHLKDRDEIKIYDPTSGSGSLLINIGQTAAKYMGDANHIRYYAQELKANTYNLTRMNLVMRGILPDNIVARNGDTLEDDWPYFDDADPAGTYTPLYVDAVVSNPPYSQRWDPSGKENDPRYAQYGLAPKSKADYAFLLHDLYHLKPDGIMTIVLPHGVLFRGGEEGQIRKNLIELNHIDTIIGLPANIFYGTGIPTIIMVLRQKRDDTDVLFIDASKGFTKEGTNNKLRACDIRRITDTVKARQDVPKYAKVVSLDEIRSNDYNLNIPRYVDASDEAETYDLYATMFGGIPETELDRLSDYWDVFPSLKDALFTTDGKYAHLKTDAMRQVVSDNSDVHAFYQRCADAFDGFAPELADLLIDHAETVPIAKTEDRIASQIFERFKDIRLVDPYAAYESFSTHYSVISGDLELLQAEGMDAAKLVDPHMVTKKKNGREHEVQEGWQGHILPFDLVQKVLLKDDLAALNAKSDRINAIAEEKSAIIDALSEDEKQNILNDDNSDFAAKALREEADDILSDITSDEIDLLNGYLALSRKKDKEAYVSAHPSDVWETMQTNKDGVTYSKSTVKSCIQQLQLQYDFDPDSYEGHVTKAVRLIDEEKELKQIIKKDEADLHQKTKTTIENLSDDQVKDLLKDKWITPICDDIAELPHDVLKDLIKKIQGLADKYSDTCEDLEQEIDETERALSDMLSELEAPPEDMAGIRELQKILGEKA
jgi:type I restriction enzyme M protein